LIDIDQAKASDDYKKITKIWDEVKKVEQLLMNLPRLGVHYPRKKMEAEGGYNNFS